LTGPDPTRQIGSIPSPRVPNGKIFIAVRRPEFASSHRRRAMGLLIAAAVMLLTMAAMTEPAAADFRLCNNTPGRVGIAIGYKDGEGWVTEGWWNLSSRSCETLLRGGLVARFYYVYAIDYDRGGEWSGQAFMCTRDKEFTIRGTDDCLARGYDRTGFFEVDTGEQRSWTVQLTESGDGARSPLQSNSPSMMPTTPRPPAGGAPPANGNQNR
jgi:uncharacterized membrane protein